MESVTLQLVEPSDVGIYTRNDVSGSLKDTLIKALKHCISEHSILSAVINDEETEAPIFSRPSTLDLNNHIEVLDSRQFSNAIDDQGLVQAALIKTHDQSLNSRDEIPPWRSKIEGKADFPI